MNHCRKVHISITNLITEMEEMKKDCIGVDWKYIRTIIPQLKISLLLADKWIEEFNEFNQPIYQRKVIRFGKKR